MTRPPFLNLTNRVFGLPEEHDPLGSRQWPDTPEFAEIKRQQGLREQELRDEITRAVRIEERQREAA